MVYVREQLLKKEQLAAAGVPDGRMNAAAAAVTTWVAA